MPELKNNLSPILPPAALSREPCLGLLSVDSERELRSSSSVATEVGQQPSSPHLVPPPTVRSAIRQCEGMHKAPLNILWTVAKPPALNHRASAVGKTKTVSFYDAALIIIEPNLRAPCQSLPCYASLAKEISTGAGPSTSVVLLQQVHSASESFCLCRRYIGYKQRASGTRPTADAKDERT